MRKTIMLAVAMLALVSCSSPSEPLAFDLTHPMLPPERPFEISGGAVDDGLVCPIGMWVEVRMEDMDGENLTIDGWSRIFDDAVAAGSVAEARSHKVFECGDNSGSIVISDHVALDFSVLDLTQLWTGETLWGTWTIGGTGEYESLSGSGDVVVSADEELFHYVGEVRG